MSEEQTLLTNAASEQETPAAAEPAASGTETTTPVQESTDWRPEALRCEKALEKYKSQDDALKALVEAQKLIGKKAEGIVPPAEDASQEEKDAFSAKLRELRGVPTEDKVPEAYAVTAPEGAPEGYTLDAEFVGAFQKMAHEAGLAPAEFKRMADGYMQMEIAAITQARASAQEQMQKSEAVLVKEWQDAGRVPKTEFSNALKAAQALGLVGKDGKDNLLGHLGNNTALIKALASNVYPLIAEGKLKGGGTADPGPAYTPKEAFEKGRAMMRDPRYRDQLQRDPEYVREVEAFFAEHGHLMRSA